jgi:hypothetical protein
MIRQVLKFSAVFAAAGMVSGCLGLTENKFEKKVIKAQCEKYQDCSPTDFDAEFDSLKSCQDAVAAESDSDLDYYEDCDFIRDEAKDCLKAIESLPCEAEEADYVDFNNSCFNVWVCEGSGTSDLSPTDSQPTGG